MTHQDSSDTAPLQASDDFVTVMIGDQSFGIPVETIQDVFQPQAITHVPLAPKLIDGVLNLRGRIVTAIDVRKRLGMEPRDRNKGCMAIGIEKDQESFGLLVDKVGEVLRVS
ncbi:MAG: chemotaxis protein CheW, partial [Pseudomonadota bacterium]